MFNSQILEVAIGMVFVYLLLSLVCSAVNEIIEASLKNRASDLENGIRKLLGDPKPGAWDRLQQFLKKAPAPAEGLATKLYNHGLVQGLYRDARNLPSYIPSRNFALALMDLVAPGSAGKSGAAGATASSPGASLADLRTAIATNISGKVQEALLALIDAAGDDANKARDNIEAWYNSTMDRVSGWYKRRTQVIILFLGVGIAVGFNADSVTVANALSRSSALRDSMVAAAQTYLKDSKGATEKPEVQLEQTKERLKGLGLPIGWSGGDTEHTWPESFDSWKHQIQSHWLGWLITAFAISLGAPFWFDVLNKFIVVRSTVKPQEKSPEESSKA